MSASVLLIHPDLTAARRACAGLEAAGYAARAVDSLSAAREAVGAGVYDLILLSNVLPGWAEAEARAAFDAVREGRGSALALLGPESPQGLAEQAAVWGADGVVSVGAELPPGPLARQVRGLLQGRGPREVASAPVAPSPPARPRALVVDDSRAMRRILRQILEEAAFEVAEAQNGREAVDHLAAASEPPDLLLIDLNMPELDGHEAVLEIRRDLGKDPLRIVLVTSETDADRVRAALQAGADEYLTKPFSRESLLSTLARLGLQLP